MKPAEPVTSTVPGPSAPPSTVSFSMDIVTAPQYVGLRQRGARAESEQVPPQVLRDPLGDLEVRDARLALEPDRRYLGLGLAQAPGLGRQLEPDLEAGAALDADGPDELDRVGLERVGRVAGTDAGEGAE